jgi:hypothetical protein
MLASGQRAIEELLSGITDELLAAGAQSGKSLREIRLVIARHPITREAHGADVMLASRPLIEGHIRRRVLALDNVTARERCDAVDLVTSADGRRVTGVRVRDRRFGRDDAALDADLVVAATGRAARIPALLAALGYRRPREDRLRIDLLYASRRMRLRPRALGADKVIGIGARPGVPQGLWLIAQENHLDYDRLRLRRRAPSAGRRERLPRIHRNRRPGRCARGDPRIGATHGDRHP